MTSPSTITPRTPFLPEDAKSWPAAAALKAPRSSLPPPPAPYPTPPAPEEVEVDPPILRYLGENFGDRIRVVHV